MSKTVNAPVATLFKAWKDEKTRARWLPRKAIAIRKATANKSMRITWVDHKTSVDVNLYAKGDSRSQVTVQHGKLARENDVPRMKAFWSKALQGLKETLEA